MDKLKTEKLKFILEKEKLNDKIQSINKSIEKIEGLIVHECKKTTGHDFITEIEFGPYGERFRYCKHCNYGL